MKKKKQAMTLLEIMIVIFIIGIIGSVLGYNMKGSLEEGKAFKCKEGSRQIYEILSLEMAKGRSLDDVEKSTLTVLRESGMLKNPEDLMKDGWGNYYRVIPNSTKDDIRVVSDSYTSYIINKKKGDIPFWMDENR